jgi:hypothetical protein
VYIRRDPSVIPTVVGLTAVDLDVGTTFMDHVVIPNAVDPLVAYRQVFCFRGR